MFKTLSHQYRLAALRLISISVSQLQFSGAANKYLAAGKTGFAFVSGILIKHSRLSVFPPGLAQKGALLATNIFVTTSPNNVKRAPAILKR